MDSRVQSTDHPPEAVGLAFPALPRVEGALSPGSLTPRLGIDSHPSCPSAPVA